MRSLFALTTFVVSLCQAADLRADDALFSEVAMESVFAETVSAPDRVASQSESRRLDWSKLGTSSEIDRITGASLLVEVLKAGDFDPQQDDGRVKIQLQHAGWKFPVSMEVQVDKDRILCELSLIQIDAKDVGTETLLQLLSLGDATEGAYFAYDRQSKMIQVRRSLANRVITARGLTADLRRMANLAVTNSDTWSKLKSRELESSSTKPAAPKFSLLGRWSAAISGSESLAIALKPDSKFQLVHLKAGKATVSQGKVARQGERLTLTGDDSVTLNCRVSQSSSDRFQLTIVGADGKATAKLDFKKAR